MPKKYIAEFIGTFALSLIVLLGVAAVGDMAFAVPLIAAVTLGLFVYTIGPISGCHINPAVTLGLLSIRKVTSKDAMNYIIAQVLGGVVAVLVAKVFIVVSPAASAAFDLRVFLAEMIGAFFFVFGISSVVYGKAKEQMSGVVVGGSLLLGILFASFSGAAGILNPAVAVALSAISITYIFAPIIGAIIGAQVYRLILEERQ